ncbi:MAG: RNA 2',3'-cyclic phosphodiesterase [Candidatus Omnitrophota bacterium]|nr:RNA 2',3'-cyclic phosphodiesterase [Candidatus Omnitrophota bacterium]
MRTFIAIELPPDIKYSISKIQDKLKISLPKVSWVIPINLHLTLKFLGEISSKKLDSINQIIKEITKTTSSFRIKLETVGIFPHISEARIIWIGSENLPQKLKEIIEQLETRLGESGIAKEKRPFRAHITIGRLRNCIASSIVEKSISDIKTDMVHKNLEFVAGGITLFESTLSSSGPTYTVLKEANFKIT